MGTEALKVQKVVEHFVVGHIGKDQIAHSQAIATSDRAGFLGFQREVASSPELNPGCCDPGGRQTDDRLPKKYNPNISICLSGCCQLLRFAISIPILARPDKSTRDDCAVHAVAGKAACCDRPWQLPHRLWRQGNSSLLFTQITHRRGISHHRRG